MKGFVDVNYKKIIWALDPQQDAEDARELVKSLQIWSRQLNCEIQPVSVFSKTFFEYPIDLAMYGNKSLRKVAHQIVERYLHNFPNIGILEPKILFSKNISNRQMALDFSRYVEKEKGSLIFVNTRQKKTRHPIRMGGFTETLIATARIPIFCLNPSAIVADETADILFATDFSAESKIALQRLMPIARSFRSKVILYNQVEFPKYYVPAYDGFMPAYDWSSLLTEIENSRMKTAKEWADDLQRNEIKSKILVDHHLNKVSSSILARAVQERVSLVVLASHSTRLTQALLGGTPRDVMLQAKCPVLIFHRPKVVRAGKVAIQVDSVRRTNQEAESAQQTAM